MLSRHEIDKAAVEAKIVSGFKRRGIITSFIHVSADLGAESSLKRNNTQTAVTNMTKQRMLQNFD